jgi:hypothetical protein
MVLLRGLGWVLLALAVTAIVYSGLAWWSDGTFRVVPLGELWSRLDPGALDFLESTSPARSALSPLVDAPALAIFAIGGLLCLWFGRRRLAGNEAAFVLGGRTRRRRRSRGALN